MRETGASLNLRLVAAKSGRYVLKGMDASLLEELIAKGQPFRIETASGRVFDVPHRDFVSFSRKRTSLTIHYEENGQEKFALVPLLTVTSAITDAPSVQA